MLGLRELFFCLTEGRHRSFGRLDRLMCDILCAGFVPLRVPQLSLQPSNFRALLGERSKDGQHPLPARGHCREEFLGKVVGGKCAVGMGEMGRHYA